MVLLTTHAKEAATTDAIEKFFSDSGSSGYEINRGKLLKRGRYEFPVVLFNGSTNNLHLHRRFCTVVVVNAGNNDWAVDKLP